jgi:tetratricopeptide (TPR) repeat protein
MAPNQKSAASAVEIDRLATQLAKDPHSKAFMPLAEEYGKVGMWEEAVAVLEDGLKYYPGFITAMVALGRAYDQLNQPTKAKAILEEAIKLSPDNLRAHRTLIKIYTAQGFTAGALKSCGVILAMNPRDEEAISVQSSLGGAEKAEPDNQKRPVPKQAHAAVPEETTTTAVFTLRAVDEPVVPLEQPLPPTKEPVVLEDEASRSPLSTSTDINDTATDSTELRQTAEDPTTILRPDGAGVAPTPSAHAGTIAQLESWLRTIQEQRRDRAASGKPSS